LPKPTFLPAVTFWLEQVKVNKVHRSYLQKGCQGCTFQGGCQSIFKAVSVVIQLEKNSLFYKHFEKRELNFQNETNKQWFQNRIIKKSFIPSGIDPKSLIIIPYFIIFFITIKSISHIFCSFQRLLHYKIVECPRPGWWKGSAFTSTESKNKNQLSFGGQASQIMLPFHRIVSSNRVLDDIRCQYTWYIGYSLSNI